MSIFTVKIVSCFLSVFLLSRCKIIFVYVYQHSFILLYQCIITTTYRYKYTVPPPRQEKCTYTYWLIINSVFIKTIINFQNWINPHTEFNCLMEDCFQTDDCSDTSTADNVKQWSHTHQETFCSVFVHILIQCLPQLIVCCEFCTVQFNCLVSSFKPIYRHIRQNLIKVASYMTKLLIHFYFEW